MTTVITCKIGDSKGVPRIWLEGEKLARAGVSVGAKYSIKELPEEGSIELVPLRDALGATTTCNVSKRVRNGIERPLMEIRTKFLSTFFAGMEKVRVAIKRGRIIVSALKIELQIRARVARLKAKLAANQKLKVASLFMGAGVLDRALHMGLLAAGVASVIQIGVELEPEYLESSLRNNVELWDEDSVAACGDIRDLELGDLVDCESEILAAGVPCTGASIGGLARLGLDNAEDHPEAGSLFVDFIEAVKLFNPAAVVMENVKTYRNTASMSVIRSKLESYGYQLFEEVLDGNDFGALEDRQRLVLIGITRGLETDFSFDNLRATVIKPASLGEVLEDVPLDSPSWKPYEYLVAKEARDKAAGKFFARTMVNPESERVPTVTKFYAKAQSTGVFLQHPTSPLLSRLLTPVEHARVKGIPESMIAGLSATVAHEVLGQSVVFPQFESLGRELGLALNMVHRDPQRVLELRSGKSVRSQHERSESDVDAGAHAEVAVVVSTPLPMVQQQLFEFEAA